MKYRTKPCEIEAVKFENSDECVSRLIEFTAGNFMPKGDIKDYTHAEIETLEGVMRADIGDYIIKGLRGEFQPCKPDVFHKKYEAVE